MNCIGISRIYSSEKSSIFSLFLWLFARHGLKKPHQFSKMLLPKGTIIIVR